MSDFQDGFFKDLWYDMVLNESRSILCGYFREEKKQHILVKLKKFCYEMSGVTGPVSISLDMLKESAELKKEKKQMEQRLARGLSGEELVNFAGQIFEGLTSGKRKEKKEDEKHPRKGAGENACVEILCRYYDFRTEYRNICSSDSEKRFSCAAVFLEELCQRADAAKVNKRKKKQALEVIYQSFEQLKKNNGKAAEKDFTETAVGRVMDLYLYAEAAQFLYNAGYPLPLENDGEEYGKAPLEPEKLNAARIKTISLKLLDYYFCKRGLSFADLSSVSKMPPAWISGSELLKEKLEEVYDFVCDNNLTTAVIPLLIDNASGSGLYILGENYLKSWDTEEQSRQKVENILGERPCCYAIIKFLNLELEDGGQYFWSPYSVVDPVYGKGDTNPEGILFHDLETALNIYKGQLQVSSQEFLYENFRSENVVYLKEDAVTIDPQFRKYFHISEEEDDLEEMLRDSKAEYKKRLSAESNWI